MKPRSERKSLRACLSTILDPRRRQGRIYPLDGVLILLILAAVNGESSLRGMWVWAQEHWLQIRAGLGERWELMPHPPQYGTLWRILALLPQGELEAALSQWVGGRRGDILSIDGKSLRGSKRRAGLPALQVVVAAAQGIRLILREEGVEEGDVTQAALRLLEGMPLEGKVVTLDAGLNQRGIAERVVEKGGPIWG